MPYSAVPIHQVHLLESIFSKRKKLNRDYLFSLQSDSLLQSHYFEAMLPIPSVEKQHRGWEDPSSYIHGHFLGHWLSAAARSSASDRDPELKAKADAIVGELARCQEENGGEWAGPIPEKYLHRVCETKVMANPHYVLHKTLMGLWEMYAFGGNRQALEVLQRFANWFVRYTAKKSDDEMDRILEIETGGVLEVWANLFQETGKEVYRTLIHKYDRRPFFDRLLRGEDPLTNVHCNTTVAEILGAAKAYEATGEERYRRIVETYWDCAIRSRGTFCTGNPTSGEVYCPSGELAPRLGISTQEHCTVYNLTRVAEFLLNWTGKAEYADYIERCLYNGTLAQQNPETGMPAYFLPLASGVHKVWGSRTNDFWCCHGTVVQAQASYERYIYYTGEGELRVAQYIPSQAEVSIEGNRVQIRQYVQTRCGGPQEMIRLDNGLNHRPREERIVIRLSVDQPTTFALTFRLPEWLAAPAEVSVNGKSYPVDSTDGWCRMMRRWSDDEVVITLPKKLRCIPLPGDCERVAFLDGPVVLGGLSERAVKLKGDRSHPEDILFPRSERPFGCWRTEYETRGQEESMIFKPLYEIIDETYTTYFPMDN